MDKAVELARTRLREAIVSVLIEALREKCGITLDTRSSEKLHDFVEFDMKEAP